MNPFAPSLLIWEISQCHSLHKERLFFFIQVTNMGGGNTREIEMQLILSGPWKSFMKLPSWGKRQRDCRVRNQNWEPGDLDGGVRGGKGAGGGTGSQWVNRTWARGQWPMGVNGGGGVLFLSTVQWTCWLEEQLKTFISAVTKSLQKSVYDSPSKACNELLDVIKGSCPILVAESEASWLTETKSFPTHKSQNSLRFGKIPWAKGRHTFTTTPSILWKIAFSWEPNVLLQMTRVLPTRI